MQKKEIFMKAYILATALVFSGVSVIHADQLPGYVQVQVDNLNLQISQLKTQREQMLRDLRSAEPNSMHQQQLQAQIERLNDQIAMLEKQVQALKGR